jgi:hypothetical protein
MKQFKLSIILILIMIHLSPILTYTQPYAVDNLRFEIKLDRDIFLLREPIWVDLYFTNENMQNISLDCLDLCWQSLKVILVNSKSDTLDYFGYIADGICHSGPVIRPKDTYNYFINLSENYGEGSSQYIPPILRYLKEDTYNLQMIIDGVYSNLVKFEIKPPGGEDRLAYDLLNKASRNGFKYYKDDIYQVINIYEKLKTRYPKSPYTELAIYELSGLYGLTGQIEKSQQNLNNLVYSYPNSHFVSKAILGLIQQMTKDDKVEFLKKIIKEFPKTKAYDWSQNYLKILEQDEK